MTRSTLNKLWCGLWIAIVAGGFAMIGGTALSVARGQTAPAAPPPRPVYPAATQPYAIDRAFYVSPAGSDAAGDGSFAKPLATVAAADTAITKARWSRPTSSNDAILVQVATYDMPWPQGINNDNVVVGAVGGTTLGQRAVFSFRQGGFNVAGRKGVHFVGIDAEATGRSGVNEDIGFNVTRIGGTPDDVTFDNCVSHGFAQGASFQGDNGSSVRVWNCFLTGNYWLPASGIPDKSQGLYIEGACPDLRNNVIAFNGWAGNLSNPAVVTALMFSHGAYVSMSHNPKPGISQGNFYISNAASGLQLRSGGDVLGDVYVTNGVACDAFTDGARGCIVGNLLLGNHEPGLFTGGGLLGQSERQIIAGNLLLRATPTGAAALLLGWNASGNDMTGTLTPSSSSSAAVTGNSGFWPAAFTNFYVPRAFATLAPNELEAATQPLPDLTDWARTIGFPGSTHQDLVAWLQANPEKVNASNCITWASGVSAKLMQPATPAASQPAPAPFDATITVHVDPAAGKVTAK